ncbi:type II secretion system F family protein [Reichenbachiella ulvae]|uniref:Type II secretion system F family protein n=1 Tax=Reichenbachiella ulvae TaxID=2980104 RepID=A0ABT3CV79_9BACT|nr:type II secretion system F family protein [Reichenbachiella ulvae]MCV9387458.1 type II secretion system F family protein [Reichenbachiella ulvae]
MNLAELKKRTETNSRAKEAAAEEKKETIWNKDIALTPKFGNKEKAVFYQQLYVLLEAGVDINSSLNHLIKQSKKPYIKEMIKKVQEALQTGNSIQEAMEQTGDFSNYEVYSVRIGEESGKLLEVFANLSEYFEEKVAQKREIMSAISYPLLIINAAVAAVLFMIFFIIPVFEGIFTRFGGDLPYLTRQVLSVSYFFRENWLILLLLVVGLAVLISFLLKRDRPYEIMETVLYKVPYLGAFFYQTIMAKFSNSMALLLGANVPLVHALEMNKAMFKSPVLNRNIDEAIEALIKGENYSEVVERSKWFDENFKVFIRIGEESSKIGYFFKKLSGEYRAAIKHQTSILNTVLEPLLIIVLGGIVGVILVSMYLPMFEISTQMSFPD